MTGFILAGLLLGYPECCIDYFCSMLHLGQDVPSYNGFIPCPEHQKLSRSGIIQLLGRDPENEPDIFWTAINANREIEKFEGMRDVYEAEGQGAFFQQCLTRARVLSESLPT